VPFIADEIRFLAEDPAPALGAPPPPARHIATPRYWLGLSPSPSQAFVSVVRTTLDELDDVIAEIRGHLREARYTRVVWSIGPSARPEGLVAALRARGFFPANEPPFEPFFTAMVLVEPPPAAPPGVEARLVRDFDEYLQTMRLAIEMMGEKEDASGWFAAARTFWDQEDGPAHYTHAAFIDGVMVGFAWVAPCAPGFMMSGSYVKPAWRGRGAYRALVGARWATAVRVGKPALAIQAGEMSRPILERCGFATICRVDVLQDPEIK
jgi:GNAT superfamily N-acetyltransferase